MSTVHALSFGVLLKRYRRAAGLTQEALAARAGYSAVYIRMLERGVRTPLPATAALLADALELAADERAALAATAARRRDNSAGVGRGSEAPLPTGGFLGALPPGPLVAREAELGQIAFALDAVLGGSGRLVLLAGEPGVGKTRLAQEVMLAARQRGCLVASGRCYEQTRTIAYYPLLEALATAFAGAPPAVRAALPERWQAVGRLLADRGLVPPLSPPAATSTADAQAADIQDVQDVQLERQRLLWAVTGFVRALAEHRPVALLLDDLHWADSASLALLAHLARHTGTARVLLLGTYRDTDVAHHRPLEAALRDLTREHLLVRLPLACLSLEGTTALLTSSLGTGAVSSELADLLHQRAGGNAFFIQELLRALVERGDVYREGERWEQRALADLIVPESVRLVIDERLARLGESARATLREASVLGQTFTFADLAGLGTRPEEELEATLDDATRANLVRETGLDGYAFAHVLLQQALYVELPARPKQRLHRAAGEALERGPELGPERRLGELAYHFARSDRPDKALPYLIQAAERASAAAAIHEEAALLGQAIDVARRTERGQVVAELRGRRGRALRIIALWPEADRELEEALQGLAPERIEPRIQALLDRAEVQHWLYDPASVRRHAAGALELAERIGRDDLAAQAMCRLALADSSEGAVRAAVERYERAFARAGHDHLGALVAGVEYSGLNLY